MTRVPGDLQTLCRLARQHEDPDEEERQLVRAKLAARLAGASAAAVATSLTAKSAAAAGTGQALAGVAASGATKAVAVSGVAVWLGGTVTVGVGMALVVQAMSASPPPAELPAVAHSTAPVTTTPVTTAPATTATVAPKAPAAPEIAPADSGVVDRLAKPTPPSGAREAAPPPVRETVNVPLSLEQEARALAEVQRALRDGRGSEALALLAEQDQRYPSGVLGAERAAARALALCAAGRFREARPIAERFSRDHARSPLAARVRRKCLDPRGNE